MAHSFITGIMLAPTIMLSAHGQVVAVPDSGTAYSGVVSRPIRDVAANDTVNGAQATLGASGSAAVSKIGTWPTGFVLSTSTGAVSTTTAVTAGAYNLRYRLCAKSKPVTCAATTDSVIVIPTSTEVQASTGSFVDIEFDWGRDGIACPTCNFGQSNARFNWTDQSGNLWVGHIDQNTGAFTPPTGNNELVDTTSFYYSVFGNGAEWAFSTQDGQVNSQLVYTRYPPGAAATSANAGAAFATPIAGGWSPNFFPGTAPGGSLVNTVNPLASQCNSDPVALAYFYGLPAPQNLFFEPLSTVAGTAPILTPFVGAYSDHRSGQKPSIRWVPCTHQIVFIGAAPPDASGNVYDQVFWYDTDTQVGQQLTFDAHEHAEAYMFQAPEFNDANVLVTISNGNEIDIYEQSGLGSNGAPTFGLVNAILSTDPAEPYMDGAEPFIHCTPTCQTYIFMELHPPTNQATYADSANGVAIANIDPARSFFKILIPEAATPTIQRIDLEYYITANGPYLYYDRNTISTRTTPFIWGNRYAIDTQLGAPSGPCVGSSAEGGMMPGC